MGSLQVQILPQLESLSSRSDVVREEIAAIKTNIMESSLRLGRLLREARDNQYHLAWGYPRWDEWAELGSGLDLSARQCYYLISVVERAEVLGIPDEQLHKVKLSKLKSILSLPADTDPDLVRSLVKDAEVATLKTVESTVGLLKNQAFVYKTLKLERETADNVYDPAMDKARSLYGNTIGYDGDLDDISDSRAIEVICADFLGGPDEEDALEAEFEDVVLTRETA